MSRKDRDTTWSTGNKTTGFQRGFITNKGKKMKREGEKIQATVKTYTQNGKGSERKRKKAVTWGGKCKEEKKT